MGGKIVFSFIVWFCSLIFIGIGIYSIKKKTPIHFWAGSKVKSEEITDIKAYNRANGIMWIIYGSTYAFAGVFALLNLVIGTKILLIAGIVGTFLLILAYNRIYQKYRA